MFTRAATATWFLAACLAGALPGSGQTPARPAAAEDPGSRQSDAAAPPATARKIGYLSLPRLLSESAVGKASSQRIADARAKGKGREVEAEQRRLQSLVQPLTRSLLRRNGLGVILAWRGAQLCLWTDGTLDLTNAVKSMLDDQTPGTVEGGIRDARLAVVKVQTLYEDTWLGTEAFRRASEDQRRSGARDPVESATPRAAATAQVGRALEDFLRRAYPSLYSFAGGASTQFLLNAADAGILWSDPVLDATDALRAKLDKDTHDKGPGTRPWTAPPAVVSYVRLRAVAEGAGLARETRARIERLLEKARAGQTTDADRRSLADAQTKLHREMVEALAEVAARECRARGVNILLSFTEAGILDADPALDLTEAIVNALGKR